MENVYLFKYIGGIPGVKDKPFIVQIDKKEFDRIREFPYCSLMKGLVIESKNKYQLAGEFKINFINPFQEMHETGWPGFVRVRNW